MKDFITSLYQALNSFKTRCNDIVKRLPPIEQFEASSEIVHGIRCLTMYCAEVAGIAENLEAKAQEYEGKLAAEVSEQLQQKLSAGEYLTKDDAIAASERAAADRESSVRQEIATIDSRRKELTTPASAGAKPVIPAELASHLTVELLKADDYRERAGKIAGRLNEIASLGMSLPSLQAEACSLPLDDAGQSAFTGRLKTVREVREAGGGSTVNPNPFLTGGAGGKPRAMI